MIKCVLKVGVIGEFQEREIGFEFDEEQESLGVALMDLGSRVLTEDFDRVHAGFAEISRALADLHNKVHFNGVHPRSAKAQSQKPNAELTRFRLESGRLACQAQGETRVERLVPAQGAGARRSTKSAPRSRRRSRLERRESGFDA